MNIPVKVKILDGFICLVFLEFLTVLLIFRPLRPFAIVGLIIIYIVMFQWFVTLRAKVISSRPKRRLKKVNRNQSKQAEFIDRRVRTLILELNR